MPGKKVVQSAWNEAKKKYSKEFQKNAKKPS